MQGDEACLIEIVKVPYTPCRAHAYSIQQGTTSASCGNILLQIDNTLFSTYAENTMSMRAMSKCEVSVLYITVRSPGSLCPMPPIAVEVLHLILSYIPRAALLLSIPAGVLVFSTRRAERKVQSAMCNVQKRERSRDFLPRVRYQRFPRPVYCHDSYRFSKNFVRRRQLVTASITRENRCSLPLQQVNFSRFFRNWRTFPKSSCTRPGSAAWFCRGLLRISVLRPI